MNKINLNTTFYDKFITFCTLYMLLKTRGVVSMKTTKKNAGKC